MVTSETPIPLFGILSNIHSNNGEEEEEKDCHNFEAETTHLDPMNVDDDLSDPDLCLDSDPNLSLTDFDYDAEIN